jgi:protein tyrosine/serine phosphatase
MKFFKILKALFYDHSFLTIFRLNFHKVSDELYRSAQPNPYQLKNIIKKYNIKTVINLRGPEKIAILDLEREICKNMNINLIEIKYHSRGIPNFERVEKAKELFETIEYPALIHCKAGSDRTGLLSALYLYFIKKVDIKEAIKQLDFIPYGHINHSKTGLIDFYFEKFIEYAEKNPNADLFSWSRDIMNKEELQKEYKSSGILNFIVDNVLRRE